jgi:lysophospholipase L1-like esterase
MKAFIAAVSFAAAASLAPVSSAQTATPAPAAVTPAVPAETGPRRFESTIVEYEKADLAKPVPACPIVFTGSSSIRRWTTLEKDMEPWNAINRGFGGSQIADVNYYFDRVVKPYKPRAIVFYAGENDINAGKAPHQVFADFEEFMRLKNRALGKTPVFVISNKPSKARMAQLVRQSELNFMLKELAAKREDLIYIDVVEPMLDKGYPKNIFVADNLHMTPAGYAIWTPVVRAVISSSGVLDKPCKP